MLTPVFIPKGIFYVYTVRTLKHKTFRKLLE